MRGSKGLNTIATRVKSDEAVCVRFSFVLVLPVASVPGVMVPAAGKFNARWSRITEQLGEDFQTLRFELFALTERMDQTIWTTRQDWGYQPAD